MNRIVSSSLRIAGKLIVPLAVLVGCADTDGPVEPPVPSASAFPIGVLDPYWGEADFREMAAVDPTFAGYYFDGSELVVLTTDTSRSESLKRDMEARRAELSPDLRDRPVSVRAADFSFNQLRGWRNKAAGVFPRSSDIAALDLDEVRNRITVSLATGSGEPEIRAMAADLGIPDDALHFEVTGDNVFAMTPPDSVHHHVRPIRGGLKTIIRWAGPPTTDGGQCTIGFNAVLDGDTVFVTASHCSERTFQVDPDSANQVDKPNHLGTEVSDPTWLFQASGDYWRYTDAAAYSLDIPQDSIGFGQIVRTTYRRKTSSQDSIGSHEIDSSNPYFSIASEVSSLTTGQELNKIGWKTGWTYGGIVASCSSVYLDGPFAVLCGYKLNALAFLGDSGAPVFSWSSGDNVSLAGIIIARENLTHGKAWFSPLPLIEYELGSLTTF